MVKLNESIVYIRTKCTVENVKKLNLWGCEIDDIELCAEMKNLAVLSLSVNHVSNLEPLRHCENLTELYLRKNKIESLCELEHLKDLKKLRVLWIDENPCTSHGDHRHKVVRMLPQLTKLDDKPVTPDDQKSPTPVVQVETIQTIAAVTIEDQRALDDLDADIFTARSLHASTATLVEHPHLVQHTRYGKTIVDTIMPSQMLNYGDASDDERHCNRGPANMMSQSVYGSLHSMNQSMHPSMNSQPINSMMTSSVHPLMTSSVHPLMSTSINNLNNTMSSSYYEADEKREEDEWGDFSLDEDARPASMDSIANRMYQSMYDGSSSARDFRSRQGHPMYSRSMSMPRRRTTRAESTSPAREHRHQKIMSAISVLLDELDSDGLKQVIDEAQRRIKKQR